MYLTLCERIICSQFVWATSAVFSVVYFIRNPGYASFVGIYIVARSIDIIQTAVRESSVRRFKNLSVVQEQEQEQEQEEQVPQEQVEQEKVNQVAQEMAVGYLKGKPWSSWSHNELIKMLRREGKSVDEISKLLFRSKVAIYCRIYKIIQDHMDENNVPIEEAFQWLYPHSSYEVIDKEFRNCLSEI